MVKIDKKLSKILAENNSRKYNLLKAAEEFTELALILIQKVNKPEKVDDIKITNEMADAEIRLSVLKNLFSVKKVKKQVLNKETKFKEFIEQGRYKNI